MSKPPNEEDVAKSLLEVGKNPQRFDLFVKNWNSIFKLSPQTSDAKFSKIEAAAISSVTSMNEVASDNAVARRVAQLLERFNSPAYLVDEKGKITAQNSAAIRTYSLIANETLDDLPFALERDESITDVIRSNLGQLRNTHDAILKRAFSKVDNSLATLSIAPSHSVGEAGFQALVFVIDARWKTAASELIKREFDLSETEKELLISFLDGYTTQAMAQERERSHSTIRTQFHSLMVKMGARSQTELFRNALSVSQFVDQISEISEVIRHPHRKHIDVVRSGGRSVEGILAGDLAGKPVVFLQSAVAYAFTSEIEKAFFDAGLCVLSICRPGYGGTELPLKGSSYVQTFADDVASILDQLGHKTAALMAYNTSSKIMYSVSEPLSDRLSGLIQVSAIVPLVHFEGLDAKAPWAQAMLRAAETHPSLAKFLIKSGTRAWKALGQARFMATQFKGVEPELEAVLSPDALAESQRALETATQQGFDVLTQDTLAAFADFSTDVASTDLPVLAIHGTADTTFPIEALRRFAQAQKARVKLVEIENAGFSVMSTHTEQIAKLIRNFV